MAKKKFTLAFPVYATAHVSVRIDEKELEGKSEQEIKELLVSEIGPITVCHQCNDTVEEIEFDDRAAGDELENVSYWED